MTTVGIAPGRADAERAAAALAAAGVGRVVLFGSVARGDADERSDIDLMAIYDDLDYGERWERRCELAGLAGRAAGFPVDVSVTDLAEWRMRTTRVATSFEGRAARDGVVLVDRPAAVDVDWGKEMVMPDSDYGDALARLDETRAALGNLLEFLRPGFIEQSGPQVEVRRRLSDRLYRGCGEAHRTVESAIKALIHLGSDPDRPARGHDIGKLCAQLPAPHRSVLPALLEPVGPEAITLWHTAAVYHRTTQGMDAAPELPADLARIACRVASYAADMFPARDPRVAAVRAYAENIEDYLAGYALDTGEPRYDGGSGGRGAHGE